MPGRVMDPPPGGAQQGEGVDREYRLAGSPFLVIPAIDLSGGRCVRLRQGKRGSEQVFSDDPAETARRWEAEGAELLHVVDLDGAFEGAPRNLGCLERIAAAVSIPVQFGGGLRAMGPVERALAAGACRVILGTGAVAGERTAGPGQADPERTGLVSQALERFGQGAVAVAIDSAGGLVRTHGWERESTLRAEDVASRAAADGVRLFVVTDIERDGMMRGPNLAIAVAVARAVGALGGRVIVSGGVSTVEQVAGLADLAASGVGLSGVILGRSLYSGAIELRAAMRAVRRGEQGGLGDGV